MLEYQKSKHDQNLESILDSIFDEIVILNKDFSIKDVNKTFCLKYGVNKEQVIGNKCYKVTHGRNKVCEPPECKCPVKDVLKTGKSSKSIHSHQVNGNEIFLEILAYPIKSESGDIEQIIKIGRDITEQKKAEIALKESERNYREAYNQANLYKDILAHDINNILLFFQLSIELLTLYQKDPTKRKKVEGLIEIAKEQINRGAKLVLNVRKLSEIKEDENNITSIEVYEILKQSIQYVIKSFQGKKIKIQIDPPNEKFYIKANNLLIDLFENILINAIRHNHNPIIDILIKISKEQKSNIDYLKMEFIDNGMGILDSIKDTIFNRGHKNNNRIVKGLGIGLSLVKKIIESYNGKIWVEDRVKGDYTKGSNFILLFELSNPKINKDTIEEVNKVKI